MPQDQKGKYVQRLKFINNNKNNNNITECFLLSYSFLNSIREEKFSCKASVALQVKGAEHLPDTQHVACGYPFKCPRILVVLHHFSILVLHLC